jgi:hypothetical protein
VVIWNFGDWWIGLDWSGHCCWTVHPIGGTKGFVGERGIDRLEMDEDEVEGKRGWDIYNKRILLALAIFPK